MEYRYWVPPKERQDMRDAVYLRMKDEGLLPYAMHDFANPTLENWQALTHPQRAWLVCGGLQDGEACGEGRKGGDAGSDAARLMGAALLSPCRGKVWEFSFTVFRAHFSQAIPLARGVLAWIFASTPCQALVGLCPVPNRHAWRLAEAVGFSVLGRLPGACQWGGRGGTVRYVDGVLVMASAKGGETMNPEQRSVESVHSQP